MSQAYRFSVAPMLDYTDRHFRVLIRQISRRSLLYTELVVAQAIHHGLRTVEHREREARLERLIGFDPIEKPLALQLGGDDPALLAEAAALAAERGYDEVNLNVGCPSDKVRRGRFGACLMADPKRVAACVAAMGEASGLPVTVKHRIGIDALDSYEALLAFVDTVSAGGARRLAIHARKAWLDGLDPRQNRTIPPLRYELVHQLKQDRPQLTLELNGGLTTLQDCVQQLQLVDGVMVGRAVYEHPLRWVAVDATIHGDGGSPATIRASTVVRGLIPHADRWLRSGGRLWAIARHLVHLVEAVPGARHWRAELSREAGARQADTRVLERAAEQLELRGL
jgi:tRNA-dihydrouridine synthase A